jgi:hypothetical protein
MVSAVRVRPTLAPWPEMPPISVVRPSGRNVIVAQKAGTKENPSSRGSFQPWIAGIRLAP